MRQRAAPVTRVRKVLQSINRTSGDVATSAIAGSGRVLLWHARAGSEPTDGREPWRPDANHPWRRGYRQRGAA